MRTTYDDANLADHGVSRDEVDEVATGSMTIELIFEPSERGNERTMLVGFTATGRLLEVGIEFFHFQERMHVFHADDATKQYEREYEARIKQ